MAEINSRSMGRKLAAAMLKEIEGADTDRLAIEQRYHEGVPQQDIFGRCLAEASASGPDAAAGFVSVLNDFLAHALTRGGAGIMAPDFYRDLTDARVERAATAQILLLRRA